MIRLAELVVLGQKAQVSDARAIMALLLSYCPLFIFILEFCPVHICNKKLKRSNKTPQCYGEQCEVFISTSEICLGSFNTLK